MGITTETILQVFEHMGLRNTRQRRLIAERLAQRAATDSYFATDDFWHELQQDDAGLGRATVYRAVEVLAQEGMLDRVEFADGTHRYRVCGGQSHHHHVTCTQCHRVVNVEECLPSEVLSAIERQTQFILKGHSLELFGQCPQCRKETDTPERTVAP
jgi:Fe2+ or Zn2+ uptake regulation protein